MKGQEHVILLNEKGESVGTAEKYAVHTAHTPLHLAFSCWIFNNEGQVLITRRSLDKKPGLVSGLTLFVVILTQVKPSSRRLPRRCRFEVGAELTSITPVYPEFRYCETDASGIVENEVCPVYAARLTNTVALNPDEVMDSHWVSLDALFQALASTPWAFSPWMVLQYRSQEARDKLVRFVPSLLPSP
ncbi:isopentenyl-diphosphate Delta-isomerase [Pseudocitrobacter faecalis]|nr:isopentenyl-diphosphate Delta-isomerase [Pseudocitrobacter faecalis]